MASRLWYLDAGVDVLSRVAILSAIATYLAGATMLIFGTLLSALYLTYRWLRDGVWHSYSLADVLARKNTSDAWFLETPMLIAMASVGGALTVGGMAILFGIGFMIIRREEKRQARGDIKRRSPGTPSRSELNPDW